MRKARYLVAGAASLLKPFFLGTVAVGMGLSDSGGFVSAYLRCLIFPSVVPALCMFFLYADEARYRAYRPLAGFMAAGSALLLAAAVWPGLRDSQKLLLAAKDAQVLAGSAIAFIAAFLADLLCALALIPDSRKRGDRASQAALPGGAAPSGDAAPSGEIPHPNDKEQ